MQYHNDNTASKSGQMAHIVLADWLHVIDLFMHATWSIDSNCNQQLQAQTANAIMHIHSSNE